LGERQTWWVPAYEQPGDKEKGTVPAPETTGNRRSGGGVEKKGQKGTTFETPAALGSVARLGGGTEQKRGHGTQTRLEKVDKEPSIIKNTEHRSLGKRKETDITKGGNGLRGLPSRLRSSEGQTRGKPGPLKKKGFRQGVSEKWLNQGGKREILATRSSKKRQ